MGETGEGPCFDFLSQNTGSLVRVVKVGVQGDPVTIEVHYNTRIERLRFSELRKWARIVR